MSSLDERYQEAIKKHLESPGLHGFETVHMDRADTERSTAVTCGETYFHLEAEGGSSNRRYSCYYGTDALKPMTNPSAGDLKKLEEAVPLPLTSVWGVVDGNRVVELYWFDNPAAFCRKIPTVLSVVSKEYAQKNLCHELWKPGKLLDVPTFWRLIAKKRLVPVARLLRLQGSVELCDFEIAGNLDRGVLANGKLLLPPEAWRHAPETTSADASSRKFIPVILND